VVAALELSVSFSAPPVFRRRALFMEGIMRWTKMFLTGALIAASWTIAAAQPAPTMRVSGTIE
jgi:hypothetical protein